MEGRLTAFDARPIPQHQIDEHALRALAQDLPAVWHDPTTDMRLKQRIVRILIHEIIVDIDDASREILLVMHWQGVTRSCASEALERSDEAVYRCRGDRAGPTHGRALER